MNALLPDVINTSRQIAARLPANLTAEELSTVLQAGEILESYIALARTEATRRIKSQQPLHGWELVPTSGKRSIPDTVLAARQLAPLLEPHQILECATLRLGDIEEMICKVEGVPAKEAKDILAEYLKGNLLKGTGGEKLQMAPKLVELTPTEKETP